MRLDVVHNGGSSQDALLLAFSAQRMDGQERSPALYPGPLRVQPMHHRRLALLGPVWPPVDAASVCARLSIVRAAWFTARLFCFLHVITKTNNQPHLTDMTGCLPLRFSQLYHNIFQHTNIVSESIIFYQHLSFPIKIYHLCISFLRNHVGDGLLQLRYAQWHIHHTMTAA